MEESDVFKEDDLDKLKKRLYKESETFKQRYGREGLSPSDSKAKGYWADSLQNKKTMRDVLNPKKKKLSKKKFFIIYLFLILIISSGIVYILWKEFGNLNVVSSKKIIMEIEGPSSIKAGELNKWYINITNNNEVALELADLVIDYPPNTMSLKNSIVTRDRIPVGKIASGQTIREEMNVYFLGKKDEIKEMTFTLEYRPEESNAILAKTVQDGVRISQSSIGMTLDLPEETESGQEIVFDVEYVSNAQILLRDLRLKIEYPPGFHFIESSPVPSDGKNNWVVGDLSPNEKRNIRVKGVLEGQDLTEIGFRTFVGVLDKEGELIAFGSSADTALLRRPFLDFGFEVSGKEIDVLRTGENINISVPWKNNLPVEVRNVAISVKLLGDAIDRRTIRASEGFYKSQEQIIIWNSSGVSQFRNVVPGQAGTVRFGFEVLDSVPISGVDDKNFVIVLDGEITGYKIAEDGQSVLVKSNQSKEVKISSTLHLVAKALHQSGPFENTGPIPPKVGEETSYTVVWSVSNLYNDLSGVVVKASVPTYVNWLGVVKPISEDVYYDTATGEISWKIGDLNAGVGVLSPAREVSFQISFVPVLNQVNKTPELVYKSVIEAIDDFTGVTLRTEESVLSTKLTDEPGFGSYMGVVVE